MTPWRAAVRQLDAGERVVLVGLIGHERQVARVVGRPRFAGETTGQKSESGLTSASSVQTAAQPPSAFIPRKRACEAGFSLPKPVQCGTW